MSELPFKLGGELEEVVNPELFHLPLSSWLSVNEGQDVAPLRRPRPDGMEEENLALQGELRGEQSLEEGVSLSVLSVLPVSDRLLHINRGRNPGFFGRVVCFASLRAAGIRLSIM